MRQWRFLGLKKPGFFCLLLALSLSTLCAAEDDSPGTAGAQSEAAIGSNNIARAYSQLQDQVVATKLAVERTRQEFKTAATQDAVTISNRLQAIQESLLAQQAELADAHRAQLQDQVLATKLAVERTRQELQAAATQDAVAISNRLQAIQESLLLQHAELAEAHHLNRLLVLVLGFFVVVILAAAGLTVYFQSRAMNRLADISAELSASRKMALALPPAASVALRDHKALSNGAAEQSSARLMGLVQVLEKRIGELEQTTGVPPKKEHEPIANGQTQKHAELTLGAKDLIAPKDGTAPVVTTKDLITTKDVTVPEDEGAPTTAPADLAASNDVPASTDTAASKDMVSAPKDPGVAKDVVTPRNVTSRKDVTANWMERAESFLAADRPEDAMAYFDAILVTEPKNAEALLKKGMALEKMSRPQEALEYYDRAIAADSNLTIAHLQRGGLCSRLEKPGEALESYEQALQTREKKQAA